MNALASFIMKGRSQAVLAVSALTVLSWIFPLASLLAAAAVALPALRRGSRDGLMVAAASLPVVALAGQLFSGNAIDAAVYSAFIWAPMILVSAMLRQSGSMAVAALGGLVMVVLAVLCIYAFVADPPALWQDAFRTTMAPMLEQAAGGKADMAAFDQTMGLFARYATGSMAAGLLLNLLGSLFLARWLQARLYNPGGFREDFLRFRLPVWLGYATVILLLASWQGGEGVNELCLNLLLPALILYVIDGFAVIHAVCARTSTGRFWLTGIYVGLVFVAPLILLIALAGFTDGWADWRARMIRL